jgi:hypothetical protein
MLKSSARSRRGSLKHIDDDNISVHSDDTVSVQKHKNLGAQHFKKGKGSLEIKEK